MRYEEEVRYILEHLERNGGTDFSFTNEDGRKWTDMDEIAYQVCNHEEGGVRFTDPTFGRRWIFFVCGNSLGEIVCDYSTSADNTINNSNCMIHKAVEDHWAENVGN